MKKQYYWAYIEETNYWEGPYDSPEDCYADASSEDFLKNTEDEEGVRPSCIYIGVSKPHELQVDAYDILERLEEELYEVVDDGVDIVDFNKDRAIIDELSESLTDTLKAWLGKYNRDPGVYTIVDIEEREID